MEPNTYYYRQTVAKKGEGWVTYACNKVGVEAKHRDWNRPDSHSGTDVTATYNGVTAYIEVKDLKRNLKHKCSALWALLKIVLRFDFLDSDPNTIKVCAISFIDMLSRPAQQLLKTFGIHLVEIGTFINQFTQWNSTVAHQQRTSLGTAIKQLLTQHVKPTTKTVNPYIEQYIEETEKSLNTEKTTQNYDYGLDFLLGVSELEPLTVESDG